MVIAIRALLIGLGPVLRTFILWGLRIGAGATAIWFLKGLADHIHGVPLLGRLSGVLNRAAGSVQHYVNANTAKQALDTQAPAVGFVTGLAQVLEGQAEAQYTVATHTFSAIETLTHSTIPAMIGGNVKPVARAAHGAARVARITNVTVNRTIGATEGETRAVSRVANRALVLGEKAWARAQAIALPGALPWVGREVNSAKALSERVNGKLRKLAELLGAGVFAGLVVRALGRSQAANIRCRNVREINRRMCGADPHLLDGLLSGLMLIVGTVSLIEFARACQTVEDEVVSGVHSFVRP